MYRYNSLVLLYFFRKSNENLDVFSTIKYRLNVKSAFFDVLREKIGKFYQPRKSVFNENI